MKVQGAIVVTLRSVAALVWAWVRCGLGCHTLKFYIKFYVMGKVRSGELF